MRPTSRPSETVAVAILNSMPYALSPFSSGLRQLSRSLFVRRRFWRGQAMTWTQEIRQNEWLGPLAQTPAYQAFLDAACAGGASRRTTPPSICFARCAKIPGAAKITWSGKKKKRCWPSRRLISSGEPVVRTRRLFTHASHGILTSRRRTPSTSRNGRKPADSSKPTPFRSLHFSLTRTLLIVANATSHVGKYSTSGAATFSQASQDR